MSTEFLQQFDEVVGKSGWRWRPSPAQLVEAWSQFVELCEEGYLDGLDEYFNDLSIRALCEHVLDDQSLQEHGELNWIRGQISAADDRFRSLLLPDVEIGRPSDPWWRRGVLHKAGDGYASEIRALLTLVWVGFVREAL